MLKNMYIPTRMCIICRARMDQNLLFRLQCNENKNLVRFTGSKRSFYLCSNCIDKEYYVKSLSKKCKLDKNKIKQQLKEIIVDVKSTN